MIQQHRVQAISFHEIGVFNDLIVEFPAIEQSEVDARKAEIHILTGPNGSGKSTLLYAIASLFSSPYEPWRMAPRVRGLSSRIDYKFAGVGYSEMVPQRGINALPIPDPTSPFGLLQTLVTASDDRWAYTAATTNPIQEYIGYQGINARRLMEVLQSTPTGPRFDFAVFAYAGQKATASGNLGAIQEIVSSPFENALTFEQTVRPHLLTQWIANKRTEAALARDEGAHGAAEEYESSISRLSSFIQAVCDLELKFRLTRRPLKVSLEIDGRDISFDVLPDGLKSIISWVADLVIRLEMVPWNDDTKSPFEQQVILLLDEIDIYLHPRWQRRILPALQLLLPNAQIFLATHSPFVVGSVSDAFVYKLDEVNNGVVTALAAGAGRSYNSILEEVFGVEERFDVETETLLRDFYRLRDGLIKGQVELADFRSVASSLVTRGEEVGLIIGREIRQLQKLLDMEIVLVSHE